jgi:SNF2 family DNA or RNA helicase
LLSIFKMQRTDLHPYQLKAIEHILDKRRCALFLDMGLGKTATTLTAISDLINASIIKKVLVIAPLRVARSVWPSEVKKWDHLSHLKVSVAVGTAQQRKDALNTKAELTIINKENVTWLVNLCAEKKVWPYDAIVCDESSCVKNPSAKIFRSLKKISKFTNLMVLLSGTPSPQGLLDLWSQVFLMDGGESLGRTMTGYKQRFFNPDFFGYTWTPKVGSPEKIYSLISDKILSMKASDYLEVPERIDLVEKIELPWAVLEKYKQFEKDLFLQFQDVEIEAMSAAVLANKLLQFCNGAIYSDEERNWTEIHTAKLDVLSELVEENAGENLIVVYNYRHDLYRIQKRFPSAVTLDKDPKTIDRWNAGEIKLMLTHPASCGHGLNLQSGGSVVVWFGLTWNLEYHKTDGRQG